MPQKKHKPEEIVANLRQVIAVLALQYDCYGYRRITALLREAGISTVL